MKIKIELDIPPEEFALATEIINALKGLTSGGSAGGGGGAVTTANRDQLLRSALIRFSHASLQVRRFAELFNDFA